MLRPLPARLAAGLPGNAVAFALFPIKQSASGAAGGIDSSALVTRLFGRHAARQPNAEILGRLPGMQAVEPMVRMAGVWFRETAH